MSLFDEIKKHREEILAIAAKHGIKDIRVFGSVARGEERDDSDIDMVVNIEKPIKESFGFLRFQREVSSLLNRKVDLVFESGIYHLLRETITKEARSI